MLLHQIYIEYFILKFGIYDSVLDIVYKNHLLLR